MSKRAWTVVFGVALVLTIVGLGLGLNILRTEGWEGVWNRKKNFIEGVRPGSKSVLEDAEKRVGYQEQSERP